MFGRLRESISTLRAGSRRPRLVARSTVSAENIGAVEETVEAAREMGFDRVSFLAVDTSSSAFGDRAVERSAYAPSPGQIADFRAAIDRLSRKGDLGVFVVEDRAGLNRLAASFETSGETRGRACNAPEWSSVIEADGRVRPCFFQPVAGSVVDAGLRAMRASVSYQSALDRLGPENPTCARCVCPKFVEPAWRQALRRFRSAISTAPGAPRERVA